MVLGLKDYACHALARMIVSDIKLYIAESERDNIHMIQRTCVPMIPEVLDKLEKIQGDMAPEELRTYTDLGIDCEGEMTGTPRMRSLRIMIPYLKNPKSKPIKIKEHCIPYFVRESIRYGMTEYLDLLIKKKYLKIRKSHVEEIVKTGFRADLFLQKIKDGKYAEYGIPPDILDSAVCSLWFCQLQSRFWKTSVHMLRFYVETFGRFKDQALDWSVLESIAAYPQDEVPEVIDILNKNITWTGNDLVYGFDCEDSLEAFMGIGKYGSLAVLRAIEEFVYDADPDIPESFDLLETVPLNRILRGAFRTGNFEFARDLIEYYAGTDKLGKDASQYLAYHCIHGIDPFIYSEPKHVSEAKRPERAAQAIGIIELMLKYEYPIHVSSVVDAAVYMFKLDEAVGTTLMENLVYPRILGDLDVLRRSECIDDADRFYAYEDDSWSSDDDDSY